MKSCQSLRELLDYFVECAAAAHRHAVKALHRDDAATYDVLTSEEKAFEHAAAMVRAYMQEHNAT